MEKIKVSEVRVRLMDRSEDGLIGWASCVVNDSIYLNNIAIRLGKDSRVVLTYPATKSRGDSRYFHFNPISQEAAQVLEAAILDKLKLASRHVGGNNGHY